MKEPLSYEKAQALFNKLSKGKPKLGHWFIASRDVSSTGFWWFKDFESVLEYVSSGMPSIEMEEIDDGYIGKFERYQDILVALSKSAPDFEELIRYHNENFSVDIEIVSIGQFDELLSSESPFARDIREEFHESTRVLGEKENKDFAEFIANYE